MREIPVFTDMMPCRLVKVYHLLEGLAFCLFRVNQTKTPTSNVIMIQFALHQGICNNTDPKI
jgi:hypothetical protein